MRSPITYTMVLFQIIQQVRTNSFDVSTCNVLYTAPLLPGTNTFHHACPGYKKPPNLGSSFKKIRLAYIDHPPYIYSTGDPAKPRGIFVELLEDFVKKACLNGAVDFAWEYYNYTKATELQDHCRANLYKCTISVPTVGDIDHSTTNFNEWAAVFPSDGVAFLTLEEEKWMLFLSALGKSFISTLPFFAIMGVAIFLSGFIMWILDTHFNKDQFPTSFFNGLFQGMWWSFICMTTVGYGDKVPSSAPARGFSIIWTIMGICMFSSFTAILSTGLNSLKNVPEIVITGNTVGCLGTTRIGKDIVSSQEGKVKVAADINELESWFLNREVDGRYLASFLNREVDGIAIEAGEMKYLWETRFSKLPEASRFKFQRYYPYGRAYGISVYKASTETEWWRTVNTDSTQPWDDCMKKYMKANNPVLKDMQFFYETTEGMVMSETFRFPKGSEPTVIIDPDSEMFKEILLESLYIFLGIVAFGIVYEVVRRRFGTKIINDDDNDIEVVSKDGELQEPSQSATKQEKRVRQIVRKTHNMISNQIEDYEKTTMSLYQTLMTSLRKEMKRVVEEGKLEGDH